MASDLNEIFGVDNVDVALLDHANPILLKTVMDNAKLLSGSMVDLFKLKMRAFHAYNDYLSYLKMESDEQRLHSKHGIGNTNEPVLFVEP